MKPFPNDMINDIRNITKKEPERGIGMYQLRMRYQKMNTKEFRFIIKQLVSNRKIELFGEDQRVRVRE